MTNKYFSVEIDLSRKGYSERYLKDFKNTLKSLGLDVIDEFGTSTLKIVEYDANNVPYAGEELVEQIKKHYDFVELNYIEEGEYEAFADPDSYAIDPGWSIKISA